MDLPADAPSDVSEHERKPMAASITKKVIDASAMTHHHHRAGGEEFDPATGEEFEVAARGR